MTRIEAEERFQELLEDASRGETIIITAEGRSPVKMTPAATPPDEQDVARWEEARQRLLDRLEKEPALYLGKFNRDDAYDD